MSSSKNENYSIRMNPELRHAIKIIAANKDMKVSDVFNIALSQYVKSNQDALTLKPVRIGATNETE